jgi:alkylation response protein AidB-like acyl-CoA dehydrogenase
MDLELSADQELLRESVRRFLGDRAPMSWVRSMLDDDRGTTDDVWRGLADLGVVSLLTSGGTMVDAGVVLEEMGRAAHPGPWLSSGVGAATLFPALGDRIGTVATDLSFVPDAVAADVVLVVDGGNVSAVHDFTATPVPTVDGTRKFGRVEVASAGEAVDGADLDLALDRLMAGAAMDGVGAASRCVELAVDYAKERHQFDKPIGSFQAVQHLCAEMLQSVELCRAGCWYALWACDQANPSERRRAVAMAQAFASESLPRVAAAAIQVHGGIGFTWESDMHLYYKRLLTLQHLYGDAAKHLETVASIVVD